MAKLFLCSSFVDVADHLVPFIGENLNGKSITFIPTASHPETYKGYVENDRKALEKIGLSIDLLDVSKHPKSGIKEKIERNDLIYISGGNTFYLLQELKNSGADEMVRQAINKGKPYIGASAGAIIMSKNISYIEKMDDKRKAEKLSDYNALALVDFYTLPHHSNAPFKKVVEEILVDYKDRLNLIPISNTQAIEVTEAQIKIVGTK